MANPRAARSRRERGVTAASVALALAASSGCSAGLPPRILWAAGAPGTVSARPERGGLAVPVIVGDHANGYFVVDTLAPVTRVVPGGLPGAALVVGMNELSRLRIGTLEFRDVRALVTDDVGASRTAGSLGADVIAQYPTSLDYAGRAVTLGDTVLPSGVAGDDGPAARVAFRPLGGGVVFVRGELLPRAMPATRVVVPAVLEGRACAMVLATAQSAVVVDRERFDSLARDGRRVIHADWQNPSGATVTVRVARARSLRVGGAEVQGLAVAGTDDGTLRALSREVGSEVCGLLGGDFLREFFVTVDYPRGVFSLWRYGARRAASDGYTRAGLWLARGTAHSYRVSRVAEGSEAQAQGVRAGDVVVAVDGAPLEPMEPDDADATLRGEPGTVHEITLERGPVRVRVEALLP